MDRKGKGESILGKVMGWIWQERTKGRNSMWAWGEWEVKGRSKYLAQQKEDTQNHSDFIEMCPVFSHVASKYCAWLSRVSCNLMSWALPAAIHLLEIPLLGQATYFWRYWFPSVNATKSLNNLFRQYIQNFSGLNLADINPKPYVRRSLFDCFFCSSCYYLH